MRFLAALLLAALLVSSCGADHRAINANGKRLLDAEIAGARQAAAAGDMAKAAALLTAVDETVRGLRARDDISDQRAAEVLAALGDAQDALRSYADARSTSTTTPATLAPATTVAPPVEKPGPGNGHGHGHGNDHGEGD
jgi:hypothetical protein